MSHLSTKTTQSQHSYSFTLYHLKDGHSAVVAPLSRRVVRVTPSLCNIQNMSLFVRAIVCASKSFLEKPPEFILQMPGFLTYLKACQSLVAENILPQTNSQLPIEKFAQAARAGFAPAQFLMSYFYSTSKVFSADPKEAIDLCQSAAEQNFAPAQLYLGYRFQNGDRGYPQDTEKATMWFNKAKQSGLPPTQVEVCYFTGKIDTHHLTKTPTLLVFPKNIASAPKPIIQEYIVTPRSLSADELSSQLNDAKKQITSLNEKLENSRKQHNDEIKFLITHIHELEESLKNKRTDDQILKWIYESAHPTPTAPIAPIAPEPDEPEIIKLDIVSSEPVPHEQPKESPTPLKRSNRPEPRTSKRQKIPSRKKLGN